MNYNCKNESRNSYMHYAVHNKYCYGLLKDRCTLQIQWLKLF